MAEPVPLEKTIPLDALDCDPLPNCRRLGNEAPVRRVPPARRTFPTKPFGEGVRWVAPISAPSRFVTADTEIRGCLIPKGDTVMTIRASACRNEEVIAIGEVFNVYCGSNQHQSFGTSPYFLSRHPCRASCREAGDAPDSVRQLPGYASAGPEAVVLRGFGFRGPKNVPVLLN